MGPMFDAAIVPIADFFQFIMIITFVLGMIGVLIAGFTGIHVGVPLMSVVFSVVMILTWPVFRVMLGSFGPLPDPSPALQDVPDFDWAPVWAVLKWVFYVLVALGTPIVIGGLIVKTRRAITWFVSPPPRWVCRWLNRPLPPVIRPLPVNPIGVDHPLLIVLDDPIFKEINEAIAAADQALYVDRLS